MTTINEQPASTLGAGCSLGKERVMGYPYKGMTCDDRLRTFVAWCRSAKAHAKARGFDTPIRYHERQVMLRFFDRGVPAYAAIKLLIDWREAEELADARRRGFQKEPSTKGEGA